jgi:hypothetical protein
MITEVLFIIFAGFSGDLLTRTSAAIQEALLPIKEPVLKSFAL